MARPKSEDKRHAIMRAAARVIVSQGLGATTASIAREAGVSNGSLFTYFETKADLFNQLYLELKTEMAAVALERLPVEASLREQLFHMWKSWMAWTIAHPDKRAALAQLGLYEDITPAIREAGHKTMASIAGLLERVRAGGAMRDAPMGLFLALMNSMADATMDFVVQDPKNMEQHCQAGFDALWRALA